MTENESHAQSAQTTEQGAEYWDVHCSRCSDPIPPTREDHVCDSCRKAIQLMLLEEGVRCKNCGGHGFVYDSICDVQRSMNGRDTRCPDCHGSGRIEWQPEIEDVHPDLKTEVKARAR
jgi:DNA-directed RNA polymerase subunit RPC12/RpoP